MFVITCLDLRSTIRSWTCESDRRASRSLILSIFTKIKDDPLSIPPLSPAQSGLNANLVCLTRTSYVDVVHSKVRYTSEID